MRELEVRRHSKRQRPGQHLTRWGVTLARLISRGGPLAAFVREQADLWQELVLRLPDGGRGLVVGHGAAYLDGVAFALRPADAALVTGPLARYCEGFRVRYE